MGNFETVVGRIRQGLNSGATAQPHDSASAPQPAALSRAPDSADLQTRFVAALSAAGGHPIEAADEASAAEKIAALLRSIGARSAAIGGGITTDSAPIATRLAEGGCEIMTIRGKDGPAVAALKQRLSKIDAGIVEADYAIAATGTLAVIGAPARPRSLSLIPPTNIVLLSAARILPNLAALLAAVGPETIASHPMVLVTGPSRTADIEKRIVIGVHGPKELYVVIVGGSGTTPETAASR